MDKIPQSRAKCNSPRRIRWKNPPIPPQMRAIFRTAARFFASRLENAERIWYNTLSVKFRASLHNLHKRFRNAVLPPTGSNAMKRILVYLKPHTRDSILAPLFKLTEALLELLIPLIVASIIDTGVATGD